MARNLGWIAAGGLSVGVVGLSLAYLTGGNDMKHLVDAGRFFGRSYDKVDARIEPRIEARVGTDESERRWIWNGDDTVEIALPATVHYRGGEGDEVIARGSPDVLSHIEIRGGRIALDCWRCAGSRDIVITLPGRAFRHVRLSGSANIVMDNVSQPDLSLSLSGSGSVRAQGAVERATVSISGSADARLAELAVKQLVINVSGSGNIEAAPKDDADIKVSGSGNVRLFTRPAHLRSQVAGSGRVTQASLDAGTGKD